MLGAELGNDAKPTGNARVLRLRIPPQPRFGKIVRDDVAAHAAGFGISATQLEDFLFAVGEAIANAIEHSGTASAIEFRCRVDAEKIVATVVDAGRGFRPSATTTTLPIGLTERGRGIPIMRACSDIFALRSVPGRGTAIVIGRYIRLRHEETSAAS